MAFKFGSIFDSFFNKNTSGGGDNTSKVDTSGTESLIEKFKKLDTEAKKIGESIEKLYEEFENLEAGADADADRLRIQQQLHDLQLKANKNEKDLDKLLKDLDEETLKYTKDQKDYFKFLKSETKTLESVQTDYETSLKNLIDNYKTGKIETDEFQEGMKKLPFEKLGGQISAMFNKTGADITNDMGALLSNVTEEVISGLEGLGPEVAIVMEVLKSTVMAAFKQILEMNDALIGLQRATGGVITATKLGYDVYGNAKDGMESLKTAAIAANVSVDQISEALQSFSQGGFSTSMIGVNNSIDSTGAALSNFAIQSAEMKKMYEADLGPAVQGFMRTFGMSTKEAGNIVVSSSNHMADLGLSVKQYVANLAEATNLMGKYYVKNALGAVKLATLATELGTSVETVAHGITEMSSITDLFTQQQKASALGMASMGSQMSKVFALRQTGKLEEANATEMRAAVKDLTSTGMVDTTNGTITGQGQTTLKAMGANEEMIKALNLMARKAKDTGMSMEDISKGAESWTSSQKATMKAWDDTNMTISEKMTKIWEGFKQNFIDPLSEAISPIITMIEDTMDSFGSIFKSLFQTLTPIFSFFIGIIKGVSEVFGTIFGWIAKLFTSFYQIAKPLFDWLTNAFRNFGEVIGIIIGISLIPWLVGLATSLATVVGTLIGSIIPSLIAFAADAWALIIAMGPIGWIALAIAGIVALLMTSKDGLGNSLKEIWEVIKSVFMPIIKMIVDGLKNLFRTLGLLEEDTSNELLPATNDFAESVNVSTGKIQETPKLDVPDVAKNLTKQYTMRGGDELKRWEALASKAFQNPNQAVKPATIVVNNTNDGMFSGTTKNNIKI